MSHKEAVDSLLSELIGKRVRTIAHDALETMNKAPTSTAVGGGDGDGDEKTIEEHDRKHHPDGYKGGKCSWRDKHGMTAGQVATGASGASGAAVATTTPTWNTGVTATGASGAPSNEATGATGESGNAEPMEKDFTGIKDGKVWKSGAELAPTFQDEGTKSKYRMARNKFVRELLGKEDGTFDLESGNPVSYNDGYQVAFQTTESEDGKMSDEEYDKIVEEIVKATGAKPNLGNFEVPEISFHVATKKQAKELMKKYNQHSIWDWKAGDIILNEDLDVATNSVKSGENKEEK